MKMMLPTSLIVASLIFSLVDGEVDRPGCIAPTNTEKCSMLMNLVPFGLQCGCANFCNGKWVSCASNAVFPNGCSGEQVTGCVSADKVINAPGPAPTNITPIGGLPVSVTRPVPTPVSATPPVPNTVGTSSLPPPGVAPVPTLSSITGVSVAVPPVVPNTPGTSPGVVPVPTRSTITGVSVSGRPPVPANTGDASSFPPPSPTRSTITGVSVSTPGSVGQTTTLGNGSNMASGGGTNLGTGRLPADRAGITACTTLPDGRKSGNCGSSVGQQSGSQSGVSVAQIVATEDTTTTMVDDSGAMSVTSMIWVAAVIAVTGVFMV